MGKYIKTKPFLKLRLRYKYEKCFWDVLVKFKIGKKLIKLDYRTFEKLSINFNYPYNQPVQRA